MRFLERSYPYIFGVLVGVLSLSFKLEISQISNFENILNATVTFSSIIIAFLSTMVSIFISLMDTKVMKRIKEEDGEGLLTSYIVETVIGGLILVVYSMILFMCIGYEGKGSVFLLSLYLLLLTYLLVSSFRILKLTTDILKNTFAESSTDNKKTSEETIAKPKINPK